MHRLRELRKKANWTQAELGKELGTGSAAISKYELNQTSLSEDTIIKLCSLFNTSADYLLMLTDVDPNSTELNNLKEGTTGEPITNILSNIEATSHSLEETYQSIERQQNIMLNSLRQYRSYMEELICRLYSSNVKLAVISKATNLSPQTIQAIIEKRKKRN